VEISRAFRRIQGAVLPPFDSSSEDSLHDLKLQAAPTRYAYCRTPSWRADAASTTPTRRSARDRRQHSPPEIYKTERKQKSEGLNGEDQQTAAFLLSAVLSLLSRWRCPEDTVRRKNGGPRATCHLEYADEVRPRQPAQAAEPWVNESSWGQRRRKTDDCAAIQAAINSAGSPCPQG
jgi:hypothetical protein